MANTLAYGFVGLENMFAERVTDDNVEQVREAIGASLAEHNRQVAAISSELVQVTEKYSARFYLPGAGTLQPLDEYGNPLPVKEAGFYDVAWPIQGGGTAWGDNRVTRALMTIDEANRHVLGSLQRDADWVKRHIFAALFDNVGWAYTDPDKGTLAVKGLANGDSVQYLKKNGLLTTDDHYLAQSADILDASNPYPTIYTELSEHRENAGATMVAYIPTNLVADTKALATFEPIQDPDIALGSGSNLLTGSIDRGFGDELLGKADKVWVVEWAMLPSDYMLCTARGASFAALRQREYPAASLKGLFQEENDPDGNLKEHRFIRYSGFGAWNRVGAVVYQIGSASYSIPTGYDAPLAV